MTQSPEGQLSPQVVLDQMKKNGVSHVIWLPDSETNWLYTLMMKEPGITVITVCREGLAYPIAAGLWLGGRTPVIQIQNTGFMEAGDSLRGWALDFRIPVVLLVGYRGWTRHGETKDTAAVYTERFLNAFGVKYYLVENDADAGRISLAFQAAQKTKQPVVVLVGDEYHGFNR